MELHGVERRPVVRKRWRKRIIKSIIITIHNKMLLIWVPRTWVAPERNQLHHTGGPRTVLEDRPQNSPNHHGYRRAAPKSALPRTLPETKRMTDWMSYSNDQQYLPFSSSPELCCHSELIGWQWTLQSAGSANLSGGRQRERVNYQSQRLRLQNRCIIVSIFFKKKWCNEVHNTEKTRLIWWLAQSNSAQLE